MIEDPRCEPTAAALHDLMALRRISTPEDGRVLRAGLATLHRIEDAWLYEPRIALLFSEAKRGLIYAAIMGDLPGPAVKRATDFLKNHLPELPKEEQVLLGIADLTPPAEKPVKTAAGLDKRVPKQQPAAQGEAPNLHSAIRTATRSDDGFAPPEPHVLRAVIEGLKAL